MSPRDIVSPITPYAPGKPVASHQNIPGERHQRRGGDSKPDDSKPEEAKTPASKSEVEKQDKTEAGVDQYA